MVNETHTKSYTGPRLYLYRVFYRVALKAPSFQSSSSPPPPPDEMFSNEEARLLSRFSWQRNLVPRSMALGTRLVATIMGLAISFPEHARSQVRGGHSSGEIELIQACDWLTADSTLDFQREFYACLAIVAKYK